MLKLNLSFEEAVSKSPFGDSLLGTLDLSPLVTFEDIESFTKQQSLLNVATGLQKLTAQVDNNTHLYPMAG